MTAVTTVSAHKDVPGAVKSEGPDTHVSSTSAPTTFPKLGSSTGIVSGPKGGMSILKSESPLPLVGNPNEIKIKREVPLKIGNFPKIIFLHWQRTFNR